MDVARTAGDISTCVPLYNGYARSRKYDATSCGTRATHAYMQFFFISARVYQRVVRGKMWRLRTLGHLLLLAARAEDFSKTKDDARRSIYSNRINALTMILFTFYSPRAGPSVAR